jgi:DNA-binding NtrC family response regulator
MQALVSYEWPGNVRELEHVIERALVLSRGGVIERQDVSVAVPRASLGRSERGGKTPDDAPASGTYTEARRQVLDDFDRRYATGLLGATAGNVSQAARLAGLDRTNFRRLMKRIGLRPR